MTPAEQDTRDRVIRLESKVESLERTIDGMAGHVKEMHELLLRAKGARYIIVAAAGIGGFISAKLAWLFPGIGNG